VGQPRLRVSVDGRALDEPGLRVQGIGRYAHGLLSELGGVAEEHGGELSVLRRRGGEGSPYDASAGRPPGRQRHLRRPPLPARAIELAEQVMLPADLARIGARVHHSLSLYGTPLASPAPVVVSMHDVVPLQWPALYLKTGLAHRALYRAVRRAAAVLCPSSAARRDVAAHLELDPGDIHLIPDAADERFRPTDPRLALDELSIPRPYLLYVGSLGDPRKDVGGLIDAFAAWSQSERRPETLVLAGPPATGAEIELRARGSDSRVRFARFVPDAQLPALLSGASCFVTASRYEGFGLPALEAIACGTPVTAYDAGAIPETAGPGALLAPPGDGAALMRAAQLVCDDPEQARRLSEEGRRHAAGFSWRRTAELTWEAYEGVARVPRR